MKERILLIGIVVLLIVSGIAFTTPPAHAAPTWPILLDAQNTGATDASPQASFSPVKTFNVGIIIEANSTTPLNGVFGWEVSIIYDKTVVVPQGDPAAASATDGSTPTVTFGAMATAGQVSWAGKIGAAQAFGSGTIVDVNSTTTEIQVFYTILSPNGPVNILPTATGTVTGNLLASVAFEVIKPAAGLVFQIDSLNTKFVDSSAHPISGVVAGPNITEAITNTPPSASFTSTHLSVGDPSCAPITGLNCSAFAFSFDGSASSDLAPGSIISPTGYFWDFGDGTQDNAFSTTNQGPIAIHDFGVLGAFTVSLRVVDNQGATGSARDSLGVVILNSQPSHTQHTVSLLDPTTTSLVCTPSSVTVGVASTCTATVTDNAAAPTPPTGS